MKRMKDNRYIEKIKKTKYFNYMLENFDEIDNERKKFNKEFITLINQKTNEMAVVLKCHLIIEYYIDRYLRVAFPTIEDFDSSSTVQIHKCLP